MLWHLLQALVSVQVASALLPSEDPPSIVIFPRDRTVVTGRVAVFFCTAVGNPRPQIEWRKNGKRVSTNRYTVTEMTGGSVLRIDPVRSGKDNATYECLAENGVGEPVRAQFVLTVLEESQVPPGFPHFKLLPNLQGVERNRSALLPCKAEGDPEPKLSWLRNDIPVDMSNPRYSLAAAGSLQIYDAQEEDQGNYECIAENSVGTAISPMATLFVRVRRVPPYFSIPPEASYEVSPGATLNLTCVAVGSPMPYVRWRKGAVDLTPESDVPVGRNVLVLDNVRESANYTCVAGSTLGSIEHVSQVLVQALPRSPSNLAVSDVTATSVRLSWSYEGSGSENIRYYVVQYKPRQANREYSETSGITTPFHHVRDLSPYTEYEFYVIAVNDLGRGSPSVPVTVTTGETEPGSAPRNLQARTLSSSTVVVQWDPPKEPNGQVMGYNVYYTTQPSIPTQSWNAQTVDNNQLTTISNLTPQTIYTIRVQAFTSRGLGPFSSPVQVKTQQGVPSQPRNLKAVAVSPTAIQLNWTRPLDPAEVVTGYELYWNDTFTQQQEHRGLPGDSQSFLLDSLQPDTVYYLWLAARSRDGEGAATPPLPVRTDQYVPGAPPQQVRGVALDSRSLRISWEPPPRELHNGAITYYKVKYVRADAAPGAAPYEALKGPAELSHTVTGLDKWTPYRVWVLAGTAVGDGPASPQVLVRTDEDVPGEPRTVKVTALNSTAIAVSWKPPSNRDRNGLIRGYQIHVQEMNSNNDLINEPLRYDVADETAEDYNVTGLQPDTQYSVQVAAVTRKGDGLRSRPRTTRTHGGVPTRPELTARIHTDDLLPLRVELHWSRPNHTYGELLQYRLRYGRMDGGALQEREIPPMDQHTTVEKLARGARYEFRLSGRNLLGWGQEAITFVSTPEGEPSLPPQNMSYRLQSPTTVVFTWEPPPALYRNGHITHYSVQFRRDSSEFSGDDRNTSQTRAVFSALEEKTDYMMRVCACTAKGCGPWSRNLTASTPGDIPSAPTNVQAVATSDQSVEVWWDVMPYFRDILGYQVLYAQTAVEDLDQWAVKMVPLTWSAELTGLESHTVYAIRVAAYTKDSLGKLSDLVTVKVTPTDVPTQLRAYGVTTHGMILSWRPPSRLDYGMFNISYSAHKEFFDSRNHPQELPIAPQSILLEAGITNCTIENLIPFTSYKVNLTAVPKDNSFRPPAKIMVTTAMAAPKPMVKPDALWPISNGDEITVMLPKASEEYGPIKQYYLVVVPSEYANKEPDDYRIEELMSTPLDEDGPYIAAAFVRQNMPERFVLGNMKVNGGFRNRKLQPYRRYRIFVRAVVDTLQKNLFTTSPFSDELSLEMLPQVRLPSADDVPNVSHIERARTDVGWIVGPVLLIVFMALFLTLFFILMKRRRQQAKAPAGGETTMKLLMNSSDLTSSHPVGGAADPVELRRLNYQTPAMVGHPPIPVSQLAAHIEALKANDNLRFSQEYESIDPGQQFTWEHSNLESNKPKNRYANVVAYDHSRVVLQPLEGVPGSDYINANYCDGYRRRNAYIATQGPLPETCGDFWRMVWEQHSVTLVMMTRLEERTRVKCDQYWPSRGSETYGLMEVTLEDVQELATYCIRTFSLKRSGYLERREVRQFQFTAWPDHGVPDHPTPFLMFLRRVRTMNPPEAGPLIVHCSAGVGRTGCFVVIDSMLERLRHEGTVDVYGHVTCLRAQRNYMVQTEDQYLFIHDALLEAVLAGNTEVPARALAAHLQSLLQLVPGEACTGMELEFKKLANMKTQANKFVSANLPVNKFKNRLMNILPYESTRVCLQPIRGVDGSDYINASFIDGYRYRNAYIATQGPMAETTEDFWRMVWEHNSNIVVMLTKLKEMGREKCHQYWPSEHSQRYLYYVVDPITEYNMPQYILREFKVTDAKDGQSRTIRQFHFTDWPEQGVPKTAEGYLEFLGQVHKTKEQFGQEGPITVHCSAGVGRTGVFISLSIVLERLQSEGVLDMFQTVRTLRTQRPGMVQSEDQYQFCYRAALEYMSSFDHYAN